MLWLNMGAINCIATNKGSAKPPQHTTCWQFTAWLVGAVLFGGLQVAASAQTNYQQLVSFNFTNPGPGGQIAPLSLGTDGYLYGFASVGGAYNSGQIFQLSADGLTFQTLLSFDSTNGASPVGRLVEGADGFLYGMTTEGGTNGSGTVFKVRKDGTSFLLLHQFNSDGTDGYRPLAGLILGQGGTLYGTTSAGGPAGAGTVFRINQDGTGYTLLHGFSVFAREQGTFPFSGVVQGVGGALYGSTEYGGANSLGLLFKVNTDGTGFTVLHDFAGPDGRPPLGELTADSDGTLYGATYYGGSNDFGTVFRLQADGSGYQILIHFVADGFGSEPFAGVSLAANGALLGSTRYGGTTNEGVLFKLNKDGTGYTILHSFAGAPNDGAQPAAALLVTPGGPIYGTTLSGGAHNNGAVFKLVLDFTPPAVTLLGRNPITNECHSPLVDPGASASDSGSGLAAFFTNNTVNINAVGTYTIQYIAADLAGNRATNSRTVYVIDTTAPVITNCPLPQVLSSNSILPDLRSQLLAGDACSTSLRIAQVPPPGTQLQPGSNSVLFLVDDGNGNTNHCSTTVTVQGSRFAAPIILGESLVGGAFQIIFSGPANQPYRVLASTDVTLPLHLWTVLANGSFSGTVTYVDTDATNYNSRFYRIGSP
jgi:uncharacterized repeat protein (TIGR03803 family)